MEYIFISLLYILVCLSYFGSIPYYIVFFLSILFLIASFIFLKRKKNSTEASILSLMAATIPISFRNIFGGDFGDLPLCWFYIVGLIYCIFIIFNHFKKYKNVKISYLSLFILYILLLTIIPFIKSTNKIEAVSEYLAYVFFLSCCMFSSITFNKLNEMSYNTVKKIYIFGGIFSSLGIIFQYIMYHFFSKKIFSILFLGVNRIYFAFILGDMSSMTVYLATVVIFLFMSVNYKKSQKIIYILLVIISMALSSARAGLISLFITIFMYIILSKKFSNYLITLPVLFIMSKFALNILNNTRQMQNNLAYFSNDTGRISGFIDSLELFKDSVFFGTGFDISDKVTTNPHNYIINLLAETGILITFLFIIFLFVLFKITLKNKLTDLKWAFISSMIGGMVSPGFFNSRFFTVIAMIIVLKGYMFEYD